jgi:transportin-3
LDGFAKKWTLIKKPLQTGAWEVVDALLREDVPVDVHFFAAQTMRKKVQRAFRELPAEAHAALRDSMLTHLGRFARGPAIVATQLACAVADLALQMTTWSHPVPDLIALLGASSPAALLDILAVVPEEVHHDGLDLNVGHRLES